MKTLLSMLFLSVILFSNCKKNNDDDDNPGGDSIVYLAGNDMSGDGSRACYWKNDMRMDLPNTSGGDAHSISVNGSNVFVGGRYWANNAQTRSLPCYWLNSTRNELDLLHERGEGIVFSIAVFNGTVYSAGRATDSLTFFANSGWRNIPCYWKNDDVVRLEMLDGFGNASASAIALLAAPNRVITFIAGTSYAPSGYDEPCYWVVDPMVITTPDAEIEANALSSKGYGGAAKKVSPGNTTGAQNNVYIAGFIDNEDGINEPCYWLNGDRTDLSKPSPNGHGVANAVDYTGNTVYVVGYTDNNIGERIPCLWKNGTRTDLPVPANANSAEATSCIVRDGNIYVSGTISTDNGEFPCYWKNGEIVLYPARGRANSMSLQ